MKTAEFDFHLPPDRIAQTPVHPRDRARLLHVGAATLADHHVGDLPRLLGPGDTLVFNDTRVIPARLVGRRDAVEVETLLHRRVDDTTWWAFARPAKRLKPDDMIWFADDFSARITARSDDGQVLLQFTERPGSILLGLERYGQIPLPPYIKRPLGATTQDREDYQTVYARRDGAVAAPTAGLHFTPPLLDRLRAVGVGMETVTLHVGAGTFLPIKTDALTAHRMHAEVGHVDAATAERINATRAAGGRIVAVGTTVLRLLESAALRTGQVNAFDDETTLFIRPGFRFQAVDRLLTNFHLPQSTLFVLVAAFSGLARMQAAYRHAIDTGYRFYSYGDCCLLERLP